MPTSTQITAAKAQLVPTPYQPLASKLDADAQANLLVHLRKYLSFTKRSSGYTQLATKIDAAVGVQAAQLQAVLNNVDETGSKTAALTGEVVYNTKENINEELEYALLVMYEPVGQNVLATSESDMAKAIRYGNCGCGRRNCNCFDEYRLTTSNC